MTVLRRGITPVVVLGDLWVAGARGHASERGAPPLEPGLATRLASRIRPEDGSQAVPIDLAGPGGIAGVVQRAAQATLMPAGGLGVFCCGAEDCADDPSMTDWITGAMGALQILGLHRPVVLVMPQHSQGRLPAGRYCSRNAKRFLQRSQRILIERMRALDYYLLVLEARMEPDLMADQLWPKPAGLDWVADKIVELVTNERLPIG